MKNWYITFGSNHQARDGSSLRNRYLVIEAETESDALDVVEKHRGTKWSFSYSEDKFAGQVEAYGLRSISLNEVSLL